MHRLAVPSLFLCVCLLASSVTGQTGDGIEVHGALRAMMHEGEIGPAVSLDTLMPAGDLYGVGALAELAGEVTIVGGKAYLSYPEGESTRTEVATDSDAPAALLVAGHVSRWQTVTTEAPIAFDALDEAIAGLAAAAGLDPDGRFPFLVEGPVEDLRWHVIDGSRLTPGASSHQAHQKAAVRSTADRTDATLIGFYSAHDQGVFTHMDSRTHVHCVVDEPLSAGHVDHVVLPAGTVVKLPAP